MIILASAEVFFLCIMYFADEWHRVNADNVFRLYILVKMYSYMRARRLILI